MMFRVDQKYIDNEISVVSDEDHDNIFFSVSLYGGCEYYPSGNYSVQMDKFKSNGRGIKTENSVKRKIWIFKGDSTSGKSFLAYKTGLDIYETDSSESLPDNISQEIIVLGNKYPFKVEDIKNRIFNFDNSDIIIIDFSKNI